MLTEAFRSPSKLWFVAESGGVNKMDHLACFVPGMLALGAYAKPDAPTFSRDMQTAKAMTYTCWQMYERTATGIAPEYVNFEPGRDNVVSRKALFSIVGIRVYFFFTALH